VWLLIFLRGLKRPLRVISHATADGRNAASLRLGIVFGKMLKKDHADV
jgi:hypothetical protein